jgi:hypothetical protein
MYMNTIGKTFRLTLQYLMFMCSGPAKTPPQVGGGREDRATLASYITLYRATVSSVLA